MFFILFQYWSGLMINIFYGYIIRMRFNTIFIYFIKPGWTRKKKDLQKMKNLRRSLRSATTSIMWYCEQSGLTKKSDLYLQNARNMQLGPSSPRIQPLGQEDQMRGIRSRLTQKPARDQPRRAGRRRLRLHEGAESRGRRVWPRGWLLVGGGPWRMYRDWFYK